MIRSIKRNISMTVDSSYISVIAVKQQQKQEEKRSDTTICLWPCSRAAKLSVLGKWKCNTFPLS